MEKKKTFHQKFIKGVIAFAAIFFILLGGLTYFSAKVDSLLYPTVTASFSNTGTLQKQSAYEGYNTLVPSSSIHGDEVYYLVKNSQGNYIVASQPVTIINSNGVQTEISRLDMGLLTICHSNKDIKVGDQVLVKADII